MRRLGRHASFAHSSMLLTTSLIKFFTWLLGKIKKQKKNNNNDKNVQTNLRTIKQHQQLDTKNTFIHSKFRVIKGDKNCIWKLLRNACMHSLTFNYKGRQNKHKLFGRLRIFCVYIFYQLSSICELQVIKEQRPIWGISYVFVDL